MKNAASSTLPFPPVGAAKARTSPRRPLANSVPAQRSPSASARSRRLHLVDRSVPLPPSAVPQPGSASGAAQARSVAAQVEWEIARQAGRRTSRLSPTGNLLLLPVQVVRPSVSARAARLLLRLFA